MPKYKVFSLKQVKQIMAKNGYKIIRYNGGHMVWQHQTTKQVIIIPQSLNPMLLRREFKTHGIIIDD